MTRLLVEVEGETEENFVNDVLSIHLYGVGYTDVHARLLGNARSRKWRGGIKNWDVVRKSILNHLKGDRGIIVTTMVDYYGLLESWPGHATASTGQKSSCERASIIEKALSDDISSALPNLDPRRFVPYVVMHEFEGLLFSDPCKFAQSIGRHAQKVDLPYLSCKFRAIRSEFPTPEDIDASPETHPSQRICAFVPRYQKPLVGVDAVKKIGLDAIRNECPVFGRWLQKLECLV